MERPLDPADAVYAVVRTIPWGRVATYGQVADAVRAVALTARQVGGIMRVCPPDVPWQRVVGAGGHLPIGKRSAELMMRQKRLLEAERVGFLEDGRVDMIAHQWQSPDTGGLFEAS
jgi:methylated-DNA-protein-cysteine methyltransferase-like protein